jgi:hypothetical protein
MCDFAWKPGVRIGGSGFTAVGPYAAELDVTLSGAGLVCGTDRWGMTGGAYYLQPSVSTGALFKRDDYAPVAKTMGYGGGGFRLGGAMHIFGLTAAGEAGLDITNAGVRVPMSVGIGYTAPTVGRFILAFDPAVHIPVFEHGDAKLSLGASLRWTATEF